ncbi:MAG: acyl-CoA dehydratase activase-related protein, partial [Actinomycetota bacterium]|nr:acyl-CoA dehydratase activase-related protein [Actinomycetota bacterium]
PGAPARSSVLGPDALASLEPTHRTTRCGGCPNACLLTVSDFGADPRTGRRRRFVTGNRCERGAGTRAAASPAPNLFAWKDRLLFDREPLTPAAALRGTVGIPRVLNMYENYPFWFTFFTHLGFRVVLSDPSDAGTYARGIESMPSENVCYPAKLAHGHVMDLVSRGVDLVWMPCVKWERREDPGADNHFNCPIVMSYSEALKLNIDELQDGTVEFLNPFVPYDRPRLLPGRLHEELVAARPSAWAGGEGAAPGAPPAPTPAEVRAAVSAALDEDARFHAAVRAKGEETLRWMDETGTHGIVLAGRPYHIDPEVNHAIPELLNGFGLAVLTEDSVAHLARPDRPIRIYDQWMYHSRLYAAAKFVTTRDNVDLIQLNSFGCGLDALTCDQVQEILEASGKVYTVLKIDQVSSLGAARIRVRSLLAALHDRESDAKQDKVEAARAMLGLSETVQDRPDACAACTSLQCPGADCCDGNSAEAGTVKPASLLRGLPYLLPTRPFKSTVFPRHNFTKEMGKQNYKILVPQMAPIHFELLEQAFRDGGYDFEVLPSVDHGAVEAGLKYVNNDICYPSILTTGQLMEAVMSGKYDIDRIALMISQTGGGCRATNYISLIRRALKDVGLEKIPVIALSFKNLGEVHPGLRITPRMVIEAFASILLGDVFMQCLYRTRPYEADPGSADALYRKWMDHCCAQMAHYTPRSFVRDAKRIIEDFDALPLVDDRSKPRVGVVGEILVKFHPTANNEVIKVIESEGCEAVVPNLLDFFLYAMTGSINQRIIGAKASSAVAMHAAIRFINACRAPIARALERSERFEPPSDILELRDKASRIIQSCNSMGEGWLLTAEMMELIESGVPNVVCTQPFACLPNHVTGKAVIKALRKMYPESNIVPVDYDPGASEVNQLNRIKLMIAVAHANFQEEQGVRPAYLDEMCDISVETHAIDTIGARDGEERIAG